MIGQKDLLDAIERQIETDEFPRFSIIVGAEGSGKKTLTTRVAYALDIPRVVLEPKVESIKDMIKNAYKIASPVLYVIIGADNMSMQARNAMLKVCEETPNNAYIMMLVTDIGVVADTLMSRAGIYYIEPYTEQEIFEYANEKYDTTKEEAGIIAELCETPGDVDLLYDYGITDFYMFVKKVVDNISSVSSANAFKIADSISFKRGTDGYDVDLFLRAFKTVCGVRMKLAVAADDMESQMYYSAGIKTVNNIINQLKITGINKGALFDIFILDIRREWA